MKGALERRRKTALESHKYLSNYADGALKVILSNWGVSCRHDGIRSMTFRERYVKWSGHLESCCRCQSSFDHRAHGFGESQDNEVQWCDVAAATTTLWVKRHNHIALALTVTGVETPRHGFRWYWSNLWSPWSRLTGNMETYYTKYEDSVCPWFDD